MEEEKSRGKGREEKKKKKRARNLIHVSLLIVTGDVPDDRELLMLQ